MLGLRKFVRFPFFLPVVLAWVFPGTGTAAEPDYSEYARLLDRYVEPIGVRYEQWHRNETDRAALRTVLDGFADVDPATLSKEEATAFYVNLYNAAMIEAVLREYPIDSVREIGFLPFAVFRREFIRLGDAKLSLDEIEKEILLEKYFDPRIHFAVNCASESCPALRGEPFRGAELDRQFEEQTVLFANSAKAARVREGEGATAYSELFQWYADDFPGDDPAVYLNRYRDDPLPTGNEIRWIDYDWSLNQL